MAEFIGPIEEKSGKRSLDDIVASIVGKREDRPDSGIAGLKAGPMAAARRSSGFDKYESSLFNDASLIAAKSLVYSARAGDKEIQKHIYSVFNEKLKFVLNNNTTGLEKDVAEKLDFKLPSRLDENSVLQILIDTYDALPNDIKIKVDASSNLAKDMSLATAIQGTNFGLAHNSDTQEIAGYYTTEIGSDNNPIKITNKFTKNNIDNYLLKEIGFAQGEGAPIPKPRFSDFQGFANGYEMYEDALKQYRKDVKQWRFENPEAKNWTLDLKAVPEANYEGAYTKFKIKNLSAVAKYETEGDEAVKKIDTSYLISNPILKDQPIEFTSKYLKQDEGGETEFGVDVPIIDGVSLYGKKYDGDWQNTTGYGVEVDKSGQLGNFDYNVLANIDQDKKANIGLDLSKELDHGGTLTTGGYIDHEGNYQAGINYNLAFGKGDDRKYKKRKSPINYDQSLIPGFVLQDGELVEKSELEQLQDKQDYENWMYGQTYGFTEPSEALEFAKKKKILAKGGRVQMVDGGIVDLLKL